MLKKCTLLWRGAHVKVKILKALTSTTFGRCVVLCGRHGTFEEDRMYFLSQARCKRHVHQRCEEAGEVRVRALISQEGLHFGASDLEVC